MPVTAEQIAQAARSRSRQGLPPTITDPDLLAEIERLVANDLPPVNAPTQDVA